MVASASQHKHTGGFYLSHNQPQRCVSFFINVTLQQKQHNQFEKNKTKQNSFLTELPHC